MTEQELKNLEYLRHTLLNGAVILAGCLKELEKTVQGMSDAVRVFQEDMKNDPDSGADTA